MSDKKELSRRDFVRTTTTAATVGIAAPAVVPGSALGQDDKPAPSERIGVELVKDDGHTPDPEAYVAIGKQALDNDLLILPCGPDVNIIRFIPPLNVSTEELDTGIDILADALAAHEGR